MSPELKEYYRTKRRRMAFYIVENERNNKENPPEVSAIIGLDKELEAVYYAARRPPLEKRAPMQLGMRINRSITSNKKEKEDKDKDNKNKKVQKRNGIHCPSMPTQWRSNLDTIIPKAEFGHFVTTRKVAKEVIK
ncbi:hypothetical protein DOM21_13995 [Bacteriovorax stolpii]|uniref:Uncharacterized protein n=1 Tax=Bacteriovorax stolpii TaxID=960 RepID=A0A2K9NPQ8_BACTC|nr:hypothetical protein [Bacteriovorax stolpii]AUN97488.1 hypothetical protein C0V70_05055 [Bacteriovorax stolpii]QDK42540.1 hypothetical protein DOM21_13995 [Bacteriovorax stolpii]TDP52666.1 hypothetical protein C8D79_2432 [Bacteriovorax stolpii]